MQYLGLFRILWTDIRGKIYPNVYHRGFDCNIESSRGRFPNLRSRLPEHYNDSIV
jgi:hypothetical protein